MSIKETFKRIDKTLIVLIVLVLIAVGIAFGKGGWELIASGFTRAGELIQTVWLRLILGFTLGGLIQVLVPRALIARWLGPGSGTRGVIIGAYTGIIMTGAPYVTLPIIASIHAAGAGAGPVIALLAGQALLGLQGLIVWQIPFLGVGIPLSRFIVGLFVAPVVGLAGATVYRALGRWTGSSSEDGVSKEEAELLPGENETDGNKKENG